MKVGLVFIPSGELDLVWPETTGATKRRSYFNANRELVFTDTPGELRYCYRWGRPGLYLEGPNFASTVVGDTYDSPSEIFYTNAIGFYGSGTLTYQDAGDVVKTLVGSPGCFTWMPYYPSKGTAKVTTYSGLSSLQHVQQINYTQNAFVGPVNPVLDGPDSQGESLTFPIDSLGEFTILVSIRDRIYGPWSQALRNPAKYGTALACNFTTNSFVITSGSDKRYVNAEFTDTALYTKRITRRMPNWSSGTEDIKNEVNNFAVKYEAGLVSVFMNGVQQVKTTTALAGETLQSITLGCQGAGKWFYDFRVYPKALPDAQLAAITGVLGL